LSESPAVKGTFDTVGRERRRVAYVPSVRTPFLPKSYLPWHQQKSPHARGRAACNRRRPEEGGGGAWESQKHRALHFIELYRALSSGATPSPQYMNKGFALQRNALADEVNVIGCGLVYHALNTRAESGRDSIYAFFFFFFFFFYSILVRLRYRTLRSTLSAINKYDCPSPLIRRLL
jgi:hypothetical protein